jgi:hypothetical protein
MRTLTAIWSLALALALGGCEPEPKPIPNPYDRLKDSTVVFNDTFMSGSSIQALHSRLFEPTCANSGCHDGNFEPDFRTVESTYQSLVGQPIIKNDPGGTFQARVVPGSADASMLMYRLTTDLGGNSGIMPLALEPNSLYTQQKDTLLADLRTWINNGCLSMSGQKPDPIDFPPTLLGVQVYQGASLLPRPGVYEALTAAVGGPSLDLWFALADDKGASSDLKNMSINWSTDPNAYDSTNERSLIAGTPIMMKGLFGATVTYNWHYVFDASSQITDDVLWFRITVSDDKNLDYCIPNKNSMFFMKKYFAIRFK